MTPNAPTRGRRRLKEKFAHAFRKINAEKIRGILNKIRERRARETPQENEEQLIEKQYSKWRKIGLGSLATGFLLGTAGALTINPILIGAGISTMFTGGIGGLHKSVQYMRKLEGEEREPSRGEQEEREPMLVEETRRWSDKIFPYLVGMSGASAGITYGIAASQQAAHVPHLAAIGALATLFPLYGPSLVLSWTVKQRLMEELKKWRLKLRRRSNQGTND